MQWAGNSWLAYSTTRFPAQVKEMRAGGALVTTPLVRYDNSSNIRAQMEKFFNACQPDCLDTNSTAYVDILAVNVFCNPDQENCNTTVTEATGALHALSSAFNSRPVYVTNWGVLDSQVSSKLQSTMEATPGFFASGSPVERVYWYGGNSTDSSNLMLQAVQGQPLSLGDVWEQTCTAINKG
jgi:hypothetical protein